MTLARLVVKNLGLGWRVNPQAISEISVVRSAALQQVYETYSSTSAADQKPDSGTSDVAVSEEDHSKKKSGLAKKHRKSASLWKNKRGDFVPSLNGLFSSSLGNALMQATDNINKLLHNLAPSRLIGRVKEKDDCYKVKFHVPGLQKEDLKITVGDGILRIVGEHKEEEGDESEDDDHWAARGFYGYYDTTLVLPDDAKVDEIKAEMKHGVLTVIIPKSEGVKKDVMVIEVN